MKNVVCLLCLLFAVLSALRAAPDSPPLPERVVSTWSASLKFVAVSDPKARTTTIYSVADSGSRTKRWAMYGWFQWVELADDGDHLILPNQNLNLIPQNYDRKMPMFHFVKRGELIGYITLDQIIKDWSKLKKGASHYAWGDVKGIHDGFYYVETVEGKKIAFDYTTGLIAPSPKE